MTNPMIDLPDMHLSDSDGAENIPPALAAPASKRPRVPRAVKPAVVATPPAQFSAPEPAPVQPQAIEPVPTAAAPADSQEDEVMATTIENATDNAQNFSNQAAGTGQAIFGEMNERAKAAMERSAKAWEELNTLAKGNLEAMLESGRIAARGLESMSQDVAEYTRKSMEASTEAARTLAQVKSPTDFVKLQGEFVRASFDRVVAEASRSTETALKLAGEVAQPLSNRMAVAAEKVRTAA